MARLTSSEVTLRTIGTHLCAIARLYGTLEEPLYAALRSGLPTDLQSRPGAGPAPDLGLLLKLPALIRELEAHGLPVPTPATGELPMPADLSATLGGSMSWRGRLWEAGSSPGTCDAIWAMRSRREACSTSTGNRPRHFGRASVPLWTDWSPSV